jgi:hypothetical protein
MRTLECQIKNIPCLSEGLADDVPLPFIKRVKKSIMRRLSFRFKQSIKKNITFLLNWIDVHLNNKKENCVAPSKYIPLNLQPSDLIRIRSKEEIKLTLDRWNQFRGCSFMPEMSPYCGTTQRVLKPVNRFVDERDGRAKRAKGIILLEGVNCQGTEDFGPCDRFCYFFWREEWLEKIS